MFVGFVISKAMGSRVLQWFLSAFTGTTLVQCVFSLAPSINSRFMIPQILIIIYQMENRSAVMAKLTKLKASENLEYLQTVQVFGQYDEEVHRYICSQHLYFCELIERLEQMPVEWQSQELKEIHRLISKDPDRVEDEAFYRIPGVQSTMSLLRAYANALETPVMNTTEYEQRVLENIALSIKKRDRLEAKPNNFFPQLTRLFKHYPPSSGYQSDYSSFHCRNLLLDGGCYDGQVNARNERHGEGVFRNTLGERYEGDWKQDMRHGYGRQVYDDGGWYEGGWSENQKHGFGKCVWANGLSYVGEWGSNKRVSPCNPMNYSFMKVFSCGYFLLLLILLSILYFQLKPPVLGDLSYMRFGDGYYSGYLVDNNRTGLGTFIWDSGDVYDGHWKDDLMDGTGIYIQRNGNINSGQFRRGEFVSGLAKFLYKNGDTYYGNVVLGQYHGSGAYVKSNNDIYQGDWDFGSMTGVSLTANKSIYLGSFSNNLPQIGKMIIPLQSEGFYIGSFQNGERSGTGLLRSSDGDLHYGNWRNGQCAGSGFHLYRNGTIAYGEYKGRQLRKGKIMVPFADDEWLFGSVLHDRVDGFATFISRSTSMYVGNWLNNEKNGAGVLFSHNGSCSIGTFKANKLHSGNSLQLDESGGWYYGQVQAGQRSGFGTVKHSDGSVYSGQWIADIKHGQGFLIEETGDFRAGLFEDGELTKGTGLITNGPGDRFFGNITKDKRNGQGVCIWRPGLHTAVYLGEWDTNEMSGSGLLINSDYSFQTGSFRSGTFIYGTVLSIYNATDAYYGSVLNTLPHGLGTYIGSTGVYTGEWNLGTQTGLGLRVTWKGDVATGFFAQDTLLSGTELRCQDNGDVYFGNTTKGRFNGLGTYLWYSSWNKSYLAAYMGEWLDGQQYGNGLLVKPNSNILQGAFDNGVFATGSGLIIYDTGDVYYGAFLNSLYHGRGAYIWINGTMYSGDWEQGKMTGNGLKVASDGSVFLGHFEDNQFRNGSVLESFAENILATALQVLFLVIIATPL